MLKSIISNFKLIESKDEFSGIPNNEIDKFVKYFMSFYHEKYGIYPIKGLTREDIIKGLQLRMKEYPNIGFDGDTTDREFVRDIVLRWRTMGKQNKDVKIPSHLPTTKYLILGGKIESELRYKLARVISVRIKDEAIERLRSGDLEEKNLDYTDLITKVKTEDGEEREVTDSEIDHAVSKLP